MGKCHKAIFCLFDGIIDDYKLSNNSGASNKCMVACNFLDLLHKNTKFWWFLAYFEFKINSRGATII